ncbi:hypothetical protein [Aestuariibaculum sediminum]|uniref:Uncharacterized protein n=1 Tax=Aestuariibaculum sediminum TaxID=2770637 RepID=A0A8J6UEQ5_9FLAO|nr:hypothetical protein [Aestuariibaculum sediminum]MBD0830926.1 hypothetical protein [Aestuariibaculum sediminum]
MIGKLFIVISYLLSYTICNGQSKLEKSQESLKEGDNTFRTEKSRNSNTDDTNSSGNFFIDTFGKLIIDAFAYTAYSILIESPFEYENKSHFAALTKHPYHQKNRGNYTYIPDESSNSFRTSITSTYIFENSKIQGNHLNVNLRFLNRIGLETDYLQLWENSTNFGKQHLALYSFTAKYYRVRTEPFDFWWGLGATYVDGSVNEWGFNYGLGFELFILQPISFDGGFHQTWVNNQSINKLNATLNYHVTRFTVSSGFEHLKIGSETFSTIQLGLGISF